MNPISDAFVVLHAGRSLGLDAIPARRAQMAPMPRTRVARVRASVTRCEDRTGVIPARIRPSHRRRHRAGAP